MDLSYSRDYEVFRSEVRAFLRARWAGPDRDRAKRHEQARAFRLAAVEGSALSRQRRNAAKFFNTLNYSRADSDDSSMISKVVWISTDGRRVAATLQYFVSESSIACATAFGEIDLPVTM